MTNEELQAVVMAREGELLKLADDYQKAQVEVKADQTRLITELYTHASLYKAGDSAEKAVYILAQLNYRMAQVIKPYLVIAEYERREADLEKMKRGI